MLSPPNEKENGACYRAGSRKENEPATVEKEYTPLTVSFNRFLLVPPAAIEPSEAKPVLSSAKPGNAATDETDEVLHEVLLAKAHKLLKECPSEVSGVYSWLLCSARVLVTAGFTDSQIEPILESLMSREPDSLDQIPCVLQTTHWLHPEADL